MEDQIISFETAKIAKEKGLILENRKNELYTEDGYLHRYMAHWLCGHSEFINAPTQSILQKWLREEFEIQMMIKPFYDSLATPKCSFVCDVIEISRTGHVIKSPKCATYEEALEIGLQNGMKLIEVKKTGDVLTIGDIEEMGAKIY